MQKSIALFVRKGLAPSKIYEPNCDLKGRDMEINSGVILSTRHQAILWNDSALSLWGENQKPSVMAEGVEDIKFLTACPDGKHFAFFTQARLYVMDITGREVWMCRINPDKSTPYGIRFSSSGDAVIFIYDYGDDNSYYCIWLYEFGRKRATELWCNSPIGHDADLQRFMVRQGLNLWEYDPILQTSELQRCADITIRQEAITRGLERGTVILDRDMGLKSHANQIRQWRGSAVQRNGEGFIILNEDGSLQWFSAGSPNPEATISGCISRELDYAIRCVGHFMLSVANDMALIQPAMVEHAMLVNRNIGIVWEANNLLSAILRGRRVVAHYADGTVEVVQSDGSVGIKYAPLSGCRAVAADIIDNILYIAYMSEGSQRIEIKTLVLEMLE